MTADILALAPEKHRSRWSRARHWWRRNATPAVNLSVVTLVTLVLLVIAADLIAPAPPNAMNLTARLSPPLAGSLMGTDATGRDIFSRVLYGGQISLLIGSVATVVGLFVGVVLGVLAGYLRGWIDEVIMYLVDVQLSLPFILLAISVALVLGTSLSVLIALAALATWPLYARVVRGDVLSLRERDFVLAARAAGGRRAHIMRQHLLPNIVAPILVLATLSVGRIILLESGLSFLNIGVDAETPSWGKMISEGRDYLATAWWLATMPGFALVLLTLSVGILGDWLRDVLDVSIS